MTNPQSPTYILGISCYFHDASACLIQDGVIVAAASEERFTRKKHDSDFPINSIQYCLSEAQITLQEIQTISFYEKPILKFERILHEFIHSFPRNLKQFYHNMPVWLGKKLFMHHTIEKELKEMLKVSLTKKQLKKYQPDIYFIPHHLSHAAAAYHNSPFENATIITLDGVGESTTTAIFSAQDRHITPLKHITYPDSLGLLYSAFTFYLGFKVNSGEYKMMGLAPYGKPQYTERIYEMMDVFEDGSFVLKQKYFSYRWGDRMINKKFDALLGKPRRKASDELLQFHKDMAASIQQVTEEIIEKIVRLSKTQNTSNNLCISGGVGLNCVSNGKISQQGLYENLFLFPACGDDGGAVGSALFLHHQLLNENNSTAPAQKTQPSSGSPYLGPASKNSAIEAFLQENQITFKKLEETEMCKTIAHEIFENNAIIGHFHGRMEFGPRALGNRSILADPRNVENWKRVNLQIKFRESFRPFAPAVLEEKSSEWFDLNTPSPYMLLVAQVKKQGLPAITHVDNSARVQTVSQKQNQRFHGIIKSFEDLSGVPVLINTSFNVRGEPIVCDYLDAWKCFLHTGIDLLVLNNYLISAQEINKKGLISRFPIQEFEED